MDTNQTSSPVSLDDKTGSLQLVDGNGTSNLPSGTFSGSKTKPNWTHVAEITGIIIGLVTIIGFFVGLIITQIIYPMM